MNSLECCTEIVGKNCVSYGAKCLELASERANVNFGGVHPWDVIFLTVGVSAILFLAAMIYSLLKRKKKGEDLNNLEG